MTCKDCIHYEACNKINETLGLPTTDKIRGSFEWCRNRGIFKDKSRFIELPCKVGDIVYQTDGVKIYESTIKNVIYETESIAFDERAIGQSIFLTREEAVKHLQI